MKDDVQKPLKRKLLKNFWSWLVRPRTIRLAVWLVRLVEEIAKVIDIL